MCGEKMKKQQNKFLLIIFFILVCSVLSAQTKTPVKNNSIRTNSIQKYISISPLLSPRICLGIVNPIKLDDDRYLESVFYVHAFETFNTLKCYGITLSANAFTAKNKRNGLYFLANGGFDYVQHGPFFGDPGGGSVNSDITSGIFPNIAFGLGYSFKIKDDSFFRLELDIGYKWFISNIYISYVW